MKISVVITTINARPHVIEKIESNRKKFRHDAPEYVVVGDKKTPSAIEDYFASLKKKGISVNYLTIPKQDAFLRKFPSLKRFLPYNTFARRNVGDLWCYENGTDLLIRIDDDNFPINSEDFLGGHMLTGTRKNLPCVKSSDGWYNCCDLLEAKGGTEFYPRGFPYPSRWNRRKISKSSHSVNIKLCAGLWTGDPDVDAITRLNRPVVAERLKENVSWVALTSGTWCPINTQNTSYHRELIPAAFISPNVGRYDDIFSGYLLRCLMDQFGDSVAYGKPILFQDRNAHDLWVDLENEMFGNRYTPDLIELLRAHKVKTSSYASAYGDLAEDLRNLKAGAKGFEVLWRGMLAWADCFH